MKFLLSDSNAPALQALLLLPAAVALPSLAVLVWASFFRKKRRRKLRGREFPANPTLAQTGGLPPLRRTGDLPEPPPS